MLSVSREYRQALAQNSKVALKVGLTLADGTEVELTGEDLAMGGLSVSEATSSNGSFDVGAAVVGTCDVKLANYGGRFDEYDFTGAEMVLHVGVALSDGTTEWLRRGTYGVEQPESYGYTIGVSGFDNLRLLQRPYSEVGTSYPATLRTIVAEACEHCDLTMLTGTFDNDSYVVTERPDDSSLSCLDVVAYAAQAAGCFCDVDPWGRLRVRWYDTSAFEQEDWLDGGTLRTETVPYSDGDDAEGGAFHTGGDDVEGGSFGAAWVPVTSISSLTTSTDDVLVTGVRVTASDEVLEDGSAGEAGESGLYGSEGYVVEVTGNPLVEYGQAAAVAALVGPRVVGMRFRPLDCSCVGSPAWEAGDPLVVTDAAQRTYIAWATQLTWKAGAYESLSCGAKTPARNSAKSASALTKAVVQARNAARAERTARQLAVAMLERQIGESSGLYETAVEQEDGSSIRYYHDKPTLAESTIVWKFTADAFAFSTDGGQTYPYGLDVTGNAILDRVYAIGLDASYINAGRVAFEGGGFIDFETGTMRLGGTAGLGESGTVEEALAAIDDARRYATDYLAFEDGELTIGATDSAIKNVMTNSSQVYRTDAGNVAWFGLNANDIWEMFIETASVRNRLSFGNFSWIARSNGNMTLKWVG